MIGLTIYLVNNPQLKKWVFFTLLAISLVLTLIGGGGNETMSALQVVTLGVILILGLFFIKGNNRKMGVIILVLTFTTALAALAIVIFSPGARIRQAAVSNLPSFGSLFDTSYYALHAAMYEYFKKLSQIAVVILAGLLALIAGYFYGKDDKSNKPSIRLEILLFLLPLIFIFLVFFCFVPGSYALGKTIPTRTMIIPGYLLVAGVFLWNLLFGIRFKALFQIENLHSRHIISVLVIAMLGLSLLFSFFMASKIIRSQPLLKQYAAEWQDMNSIISNAKSSGSKTVTIAPLPDWAGLEGINQDPNHWVNICASDYFGLSIVTSK